MANLKEISNRITSIGSTIKITSAMKMVSAAKLKKAQDAITAMRPYADKLTQLLQDLSATLEGDTGSVYATEREINKTLVVVVTSNRGLCGGFNSNIIKHVKSLMTTTYLNQDVDFICIGKKGNDAFSINHNVIDNRSDLFDSLTFENVSALSEQLMKAFVDGTYDKIDIVYNKFKNAATQIVTTEQFLPIVSKSDSDTVVSDVNLDYVFEPSKREIIEQLIPKSLKTQMYKAIRDSFAAEHGARMTAMHKATDNAGELKDALTLQFNKARQAAITAEILEIVGGAEALNN